MGNNLTFSEILLNLTNPYQYFNNCKINNSMLRLKKNEKIQEIHLVPTQAYDFKHLEIFHTHSHRAKTILKSNKGRHSLAKILDHLSPCAQLILLITG